MTGLDVLVLICSMAAQPCYVHENIVLVPDYIPPHICVDDLPSYEIEGVIVKPVHLGMQV